MPDTPRYSGRPDALEREEFVPFVEELAEASSVLIRRHYLTGIGVDHKRDLSPVTAADRGAEIAMRELIEHRYPDHGVLGEEFGETNPGARYRWVLDPIDGTKAFASSNPLFGTLIGLVHRGVPVVGVLDAPALCERWSAARGLGARHQGDHGLAAPGALGEVVGVHGVVAAIGPVEPDHDHLSRIAHHEACALQ